MPQPTNLFLITPQKKNAEHSKSIVKPSLYLILLCRAKWGSNESTLSTLGFSKLNTAQYYSLMYIHSTNIFPEHLDGLVLGAENTITIPASIRFILIQ